MFPTFVPIEEGLRDSGEPLFTNGHHYLVWIRDTYVRDTPFKYRDLKEIHDELQELRPSRYYYQWQSLQKILKWWRQRGLITALDEHDSHAGDHTLIFTSYFKRNVRESKDPVVGPVIAEAVTECLDLLD